MAIVEELTAKEEFLRVNMLVTSCEVFCDTTFHLFPVSEI